jgi:MFS family permease
MFPPIGSTLQHEIEISGRTIRSDRSPLSSSVAEVSQCICGRSFRIVPEDPRALRHPFAHACSLPGRIIVLGPIEFAGHARERLNLAGPLAPDRLIELETACDVLGAAPLQENRKRKAVFDRLTGTLADVRNHGVCGVPHERNALHRPIRQRRAVIDAPAKRLSAAGGLAAISSAIAIPLVGWLIDRWGVRPILLPVIVLSASSIALLALTPDSIPVFMLLFAVTGLLGAGQGPLGYAKCVSAWFDEKRGLALGVTMSGIGIGAALVPQYAQWLIGNFGWRMAYVGLGLLTLMVAFPAVLLFLSEPARVTSRSPIAPAEASERRLPDLEVREALAKPQFWLMAFALMLVSTVTQGMVVHTVPLLTDKGFSPEAAAALMIAVGLSTMAGRLLSGYLVDRIFAPFVAAFFFMLPCLGIYLLDSALSPVAGIISLGLASGTEIDMIGFFTSRYFGMKRFGQL